MRDCSSASRALASRPAATAVARRSQPGPGSAGQRRAGQRPRPAARRPWPVLGQPGPPQRPPGDQGRGRAQCQHGCPRRAAAVRRASADFSAHTVTSHSSVPASADVHRAGLPQPASRRGRSARPARRVASAACTNSTTRSASSRVADVERRRWPRSLARAFSSSSGSKCVGAKALECRSAGRVLAGHTLTGRVSAPPRSVSEGSRGRIAAHRRRRARAGRRQLRRPWRLPDRRA